MSDHESFEERIENMVTAYRNEFPCRCEADGYANYKRISPRCEYHDAEIVCRILAEKFLEGDPVYQYIKEPCRCGLDDCPYPNGLERKLVRLEVPEDE